MPTTVVNAGFLLEQAGAAANVRAEGDGVRVPSNPWFTFHDCNAWEMAKALVDHVAESIEPLPVPDWRDWNGTDRVGQFLNRIDDYAGWYPTTGDYSIPGFARRPAGYLSGNAQFFECIIADWMLPYVSGQSGDPLGSLLKYLPPIWPGADFVTMGEPVSLAPNFTVDGPLSGLLVSIAEVPASTGSYDWGDLTQYPRAGYVTFRSDAACVEDPQPLTFQGHIVCPKLCRVADKVYGRCKAGVEGLVTPWTYLAP